MSPPDEARAVVLDALVERYNHPTVNHVTARAFREKVDLSQQLIGRVLADLADEGYLEPYQTESIHPSTWRMTDKLRGAAGGDD